jgi:hypothetical protein
MKTSVLATAVGILVALSTNSALGDSYATNTDGLIIGATTFRTSKNVVLGVVSDATAFSAQSGHENGTRIYAIRSNTSKVFQCPKDVFNPGNLRAQVSPGGTNADYESVNPWVSM